MKLNEKLLPKLNYMVACLSSNYTIRAIATQETLPLNRFKYKNGDKLSIANNGIVIGKGISEVIVSAQVYWYTNVRSSKCIIYITKNDSIFTTTNTKFTDDYEHQVAPTVVIPVQEGDVINLKVRNNSNKSLISYYDTGTFLNVIAIDKE